MYYSCDDQFGQDKDSDNEQGVEDESFNINVAGNTNFYGRQYVEGLFLHRITKLLVLTILLEISFLKKNK